MSNTPSTLDTKLRALRKAANLSVQQLARRAKVPATLISGLQTGHRTVGEDNATKIGKALGLEGLSLKEFVYLALNGAAGKVLAENQPYPAEVLNLVASELSGHGIGPDQVARCVLNPSFGEPADAAIHLKDGSKALIKVEVLPL